MGLIKSPEAPSSIARFSMADIERQAHAIIVRAKNQAARILTEAQRIGEALKAQARAEGFEGGHRAGLEQGGVEGRMQGHHEALDETRRSLAQLAAALSAAAQELDASRCMLESEAATEVMRLAVAIARRVTKRLAANDPLVITANVAEAMKLAVRANDVRIAVNPAQKQALDATLPELKMQWPALLHVEVIADETIAPGGCRIHGAGGQVDAELDVQIDRIAADLLPEFP